MTSQNNWVGHVKIGGSNCHANGPSILGLRRQRNLWLLPFMGSSYSPFLAIIENLCYFTFHYKIRETTGGRIEVHFLGGHGFAIEV